MFAIVIAHKYTVMSRATAFNGTLSRAKPIQAHV
jgi:hypothetical protein